MNAPKPTHGLSYWGIDSVTIQPLIFIQQLI